MKALKKHGTGHLRKPLGLQKDGDLNRLLFAVLICKNPDAVLFSKVTGHARQEHVEAGLTTAEKMAGNKIADETADKGHRLHPNDAKTIVAWIHARHELYKKLMWGYTK